MRKRGYGMKTAIRIAAIKRLADSVQTSGLRKAAFDCGEMDRKVKMMSDKEYSAFMQKIAGKDSSF